MDTLEIDNVINTFISVMEDSPVKKVLVKLTLLFKKDVVEVVQAEIIAINEDELKNGEVQKTNQEEQTEKKETKAEERI